MAESTTSSSFQELDQLKVGDEYRTQFTQQSAEPKTLDPDPFKLSEEIAPSHLKLGEPDWRAKSLGSNSGIRSGYTYLAQLMGHDIGSSSMLFEAPFTVSMSAAEIANRPRLVAQVTKNYGEKIKSLDDNEKAVESNSDNEVVRYNLIENALTLETIYGSGPRVLTHLFEPKTLQFRFEPDSRQSKELDLGDEDPIRAIYDQRNRDTPMLHELAVSWMLFHNIIEEKLREHFPNNLERYAIARSHCVKTWHNIIREDLLPQFVRPQVVKSAEQNIASWSLGDVDLLHGLFRAFHSLPLSNYPIGDPSVRTQPLTKLIRSEAKKGFDPELAPSEWRINWGRFFDPNTGSTPITGVCLSVASSFKRSSHSISVADQGTNTSTGVISYNSDTISAIRTELVSALKLQNNLSAQDVTDRLKRDVGKDLADQVTSVLFGRSLAYTLMAEAQLDGTKGGFGFVGSALLHASIEHRLRQVHFPEINGLPADVIADGHNLPTPKSMLELIYLSTPL